jgi:hypothetical protein
MSKGKYTTKVIDLTKMNMEQLADKMEAAVNGGETDSSPIEIRSATLNGLFCAPYTYNLRLGGGMTNKMLCKKSEVPVHEDLPATFRKLNVHLAVKCEVVEPESIRDIDGIAEYDAEIHEEKGVEHKVSHFDVTAWRLEGEGDDEGVVLIGTMALSTGERMKLETPSIEWEGDYPFVNELRMVVVDLQREVLLYALAKKRAPIQQSQIDYPETETNHQEPDYAEAGI